MVGILTAKGCRKRGGRCDVSGRLIQPPKHDGRIGSQGLPPSPDHPREKGNDYLIFAGRIADTGRDPVPLMKEAVELLRPHPKAELIWASPRELLNIFQADAIGCHIITATNDILRKLSLVGKDLGDFSLETAKMFYQDAKQSGFHL